MNILSTSFSGRIADPVMHNPVPLYRQNGTNTCPGCGKSHWLVGRMMAQCAFCETALPLAQGWRFEGLTVE